MFEELESKYRTLEPFMRQRWVLQITVPFKPRGN